MLFGVPGACVVSRVFFWRPGYFCGLLGVSDASVVSRVPIQFWCPRSSLVSRMLLWCPGWFLVVLVAFW